MLNYLINAPWNAMASLTAISLTFPLNFGLCFSIIYRNHFLEINRQKYKKKQLEFSDTVREEMHKYPWPGNVRELAHTIERLVLISTDGMIHSPGLLQSHDQAKSQNYGPQKADDITFDFGSGQCTLAAVEKQLLEQALSYTDGNVSEVARLLGLTRGALRHRLDKRGIGSN